MSSPRERPFSTGWMLASMVLFIVSELLLGGLVGDLVVGRYMSLQLRFMLQGLLQLAAYFAGGFVIGLISPGVRVLEPAIGAFLSIGVVFILTFLTPYCFIHVGLTKMVVGGLVALFLAYSGAQLGERLTGKLRKERSPS